MSNSLLDLPLLLETRRNHALEHATIHILSRQKPGRRLAGHSNPTGFFVFGDVDAQDIWASCTEGFERLHLGERGLAVHPGCGTNLATSTFLAAGFAWFVLRGNKSFFTRILLLPLAVAFAFLGALLARPLGPWLQEHVTTEADLGPLQIVDITPMGKGIHRVITR